ncbi:MAG: virulence RhuM family protein [Holosporales bacterium]|jgi:hypothetical protein|nr:virulence RhuM family protein [Holosporales bacterium]
MKNQGEIVLYQPDETVSLEVKLEDDTVWLTQAQITELFQKNVSTISRHISNIFKEKELDKESNLRFLQIANSDKPIMLYSLDVIISVGYRVKSQRGIDFRKWANRVLKEYLLKGYIMNAKSQAIEKKLDEHDKQIATLTEKVDFFVRTSLPPVEGVFFDGQIFDAYVFATDLIKSAKRSLFLIDNYVDESVLLMLAKRNPGVTASIYTGKISGQLHLDLQKHNTQYPEIIIREYSQSHDRFLILDETEVYHIGASLKDLGKKLFAFSKMSIQAQIILNQL